MSRCRYWRRLSRVGVQHSRNVFFDRKLWIAGALFQFGLPVMVNPVAQNQRLPEFPYLRRAFRKAAAPACLRSSRISRIEPRPPRIRGGEFRRCLKRKNLAAGFHRKGHHENATSGPIFSRAFSRNRTYNPLTRPAQARQRNFPEAGRAAEDEDRVGADRHAPELPKKNEAK